MRLRISSLAVPPRAIAFAAAASLSPYADAHAFAAPYALPVPFWLYAYGSTIALVVSFIFFALFSSTSSTRNNANSTNRSVVSDKPREVRLPLWIAPVSRGVSCLLLFFTIVCGLIGTPNPMLNFNMTWFWMIFMLILFYATALIGNVYPLFSPWAGVCLALERICKISFKGVFIYPTRWGYIPALMMYMSLIALELFGKALPENLSSYLIGYCLWCLIGAWLFGEEEWLTHADAFAVLFFLAGLLSAFRWSTSRRHIHVTVRSIFGGLAETPNPSFSLTLFILFMLSSTAFDGIHDTLLWNTGFWIKIFPVIQPLLLHYATDQYGVAATLYYVWQWLCLGISPFAYLAAYAGVLALGKIIVGSNASLGKLISDFSWSLVPIGFFYNVTHYYTVAISQSLQITRLISDPIGKHWDIFHTANLNVMPLLLDASFVWHSQVVLILAGHILSVYLAHSQSFNSFDSRRGAIFSQVPMLVLMVLLTTSGLWILSLPMAVG